MKIGADGELPGTNDQALWADFGVATTNTGIDEQERADAAERLRGHILTLVTELDEERKKVASLMQPLPENGQDELPFVLMRRWIADYQKEKQIHRMEVAELKSRIEELRVELDRRK